MSENILTGPVILNQTSAKERTSFPPQIKYIVGNEACERFSFYGMRSILVYYMVHYLSFAEANAKGIFHMFVMANYFFPLVGGYIADRYLGKYRTILYVSLLYCFGHLVLSIWDGPNGLIAGLTLVAMGAGGIKPCVSAHVGDQFTQANQHLLSKIYEIFYFSINFGSFFSTLLIPWILPRYGASVAFGIPGILMILATWVFWLGRGQYVHVPPSGKAGSSQFWAILFYGLTHLGQKQSGQRWLDTARAKYPGEKVDGALAALDVFKVIVFVAAFWALFDQHSSSWVIQAEKMSREFMGITLEASQISAMNPIMVMVLVPVFSLGVYPLVERLGFKVTPLRKMGAGMVMTGLAFVCAGAVQTAIDSGVTVPVAMQFFQYLVLTAAEVLVSITGLEFAYTQAPRSMKSTIMGLWLLTVTLGNWITAIVSFLNRFQGATEFYFYATMMFVVAGIFVWMATRYQERNYVEA